MLYSNDDDMKSISGGTSDFKAIRDRDAYFVDKSGLISEILDDQKMAYLFTRPRRFGKSLNLSMLDAFFNIKYPKDNKWFDGLEISKREDLQVHKNAYPVIYLDLKDEVDSYELFMEKMRSVFSKAVLDHEYLFDSDKISNTVKKVLERVLDEEANETQTAESILTLTDALETYHGKKTIVLIDEYDSIPMKTYKSEDFPKIMQFLKRLILSATKGNDHLFFAVMTGVTQISKESIFSGSNHISVYNIFSKEFSNRFGFTSDEVKQICEDYGHPEKFEEAKEWYDGYRFGDDDIFNPWSVLTYVDKEFTPDSYWAGTSGNSILDDLLDVADMCTSEKILRLANNEEISEQLEQSTIFQDIHDGNMTALFSTMAISGYLKAIPESDDSYLISLPNWEMRKVFIKVIINRYSGNTSASRSFIDAVISDDEGRIAKSMYELMQRTNFGLFSTEKDYHLYFGGVCANADGKYDVLLDLPNGNGRPDIIMKRRSGTSPNIVIEVKNVAHNDRRPDRLNDIALEAVEQVKKKDYIHGLTGKTIIYGIAMNGRDPTIRSEILYL